MNTKPTVFIADLHLSLDTPKLNALFLACLQQWQGKVSALYILGDLFELWVGDDAADEVAGEVQTALQAFSQHAPVYFICGNRDFLLGKRYAQAAGMTLLPEQYCFDLFGKKILLMHGDEMCTDDVAYQRYRSWIRFPLIRKALLCLPRQKRLQIAAKIRANSQRKKDANGLTEIGDVSTQGLQTALQRFAGVDYLIHGHTHRPAIHQIDFEGKTVQRIVIPDWRDDFGGCVLEANGDVRLAYFRQDDLAEVL
ncbi:MAG: UDP-2,3-diacylglucosamine diphosphatase [Neisseria sp.]|nr:UDP-2,3-diacylglucosamine diphosphatase [Neisseria sp.]